MHWSVLFSKAVGVNLKLYQSNTPFKETRREKNTVKSNSR